MSADVVADMGLTCHFHAGPTRQWHFFFIIDNSVLDVGVNDMWVYILTMSKLPAKNRSQRKCEWFQLVRGLDTRFCNWRKVGL